VYDATIQFGAETDTDDATGRIVRESPTPAEADIGRAVERLTGVIDQVPPAYSAKKVDGTRAYAAARRGKTLELRPAQVTIYSWSLGQVIDGALTARITCSGGTYIRALARDLGRLSNSAAHLSALRRVRSGSFAVDDASSLDQLRAGDFTMRTLRAAIPSLPVRRLNDVELARVLHGSAIDASGDAAQMDATRLALIDDEQALVAIAERAGDELHPKLVLRDA